MHSPSISTFGSHSKRLRERVSSTGFSRATLMKRTTAAGPVNLEGSPRAELLCLPKGCHKVACNDARLSLVLSRRERTESMKFSELAPDDSNRKERQISALAPLLKWANTSGMRLFADPQRQSSAWADDMVMDRGAEGAARGCDAV